MLVFVAHNGRTLELQALPGTRVQAVQEALAGLTGIAAQDQILMCEGVPLAASKPLSAYSLPADSSKARDVFLYSKSHLRSAAARPPPESLPSFTLRVPTPANTYDGHALYQASSPLVRALPDYARQFQQHLARGEALLLLTQERAAVCQQLVADMDVQGRAMDAARANVEQHYTFIQSRHTDFMRRYEAQRAQHEEVLGSFQANLDLLARLEVHPSAQRPGLRRLADVVPEPRLREWAARCTASHRSLAGKVGQLGQLFGGLKEDVEALLLQAPSVSLDELAAQLHSTATMLQEQELAVEGLRSNMRQVEQFVQEAEQQLQSGAGPSQRSPLETCHLVEGLSESHQAVLLPRLEGYEAACARFCQRCLDGKNQVTQEIYAQLARISSQQSKIRAIRDQLAAFGEAIVKQETDFGELLLVARVPAAYRHCLAECMRRRAFAEVYAAQAQQMAERMGKLRAKEVSQREAFRVQVQPPMPEQLLSGLGLLAPPALCDISVPLLSEGLPGITLADIRQIPLPGDLPPAGPRGPAGLPPVAAAADDSDPSGPEQEGLAAQSLQLENARLRAEVATASALECSRSMLQAGPLRDPDTTRGDPPASSVAPGGSHAASRFREALAAKDELLRQLQSEHDAARWQAAQYEQRVGDLEAALQASNTKMSGLLGRRGPFAVDASQPGLAGLVRLSASRSSPADPSEAEPGPSYKPGSTPFAQAAQQPSHSLSDSGPAPGFRSPQRSISLGKSLPHFSSDDAGGRPLEPSPADQGDGNPQLELVPGQATEQRPHQAHSAGQSQQPQLHHHTGQGPSATASSAPPEALHTASDSLGRGPAQVPAAQQSPDPQSGDIQRPQQPQASPPVAVMPEAEAQSFATAALGRSSPRATQPASMEAGHAASQGSGAAVVDDSSPRRRSLVADLVRRAFFPLS